MSYRITEDCISCGDCFRECKIKAVSSDTNPYSINQEICVECGACQFVCDLSAIAHELGMKKSCCGN